MRHNKLLPALLFLFTVSFVSCNNEEDSDVFKEIPKEYELVSIQWKLDESNGDTVKVITKELEEKTISNTTTTNMPVVNKPLETVRQTSYFQCADKDAEFLSKWKEKIEVTIPTEPVILSSQHGYLVGGEKVPLEFMKENEVEMTTEISEETNLPPNTKITYGGIVYLKEITATYCLKFAQAGSSFAEVEIVGKWKGVIYDHIESETIVNAIL